MARQYIPLLAITAPLLVACATPLMPSERVLSVQVHRQTSSLLDKCLRLAPVSVRGQGSIGMNHSALDIARINAEQKARETVADAGGDTVVLTTADMVSFTPGMPAIAVVQVQGVGFRCKN